MRGAVERAAGSVSGDGAAATGLSLERPPKPELGDYSTNAAMLLAGPMRRNPREVAEALAAELRDVLSGSLERVEVAGPGFVNLFLSDAWFKRAIEALAEAGDRLGERRTRNPERVLVEFVSANPTGPLTAAGGRHAAFGDSVARLLAAVGHEVGREYYVNDQGGQIERFAASIAAAMRGEPAPEDGYEGDYVADLAGELAAEGVDPAELDALGRLGVERMVEQIRASLHRYRSRFRHLDLASGTSTRPGRPPQRSTACATPGTPTRARARSGCAPPSSATTRTGSCCGPTGRRPTSPATSPTTGRSWSAATSG